MENADYWGLTPARTSDGMRSKAGFCVTSQKTNEAIPAGEVKNVLHAGKKPELESREECDW
jgi:hypothetical protein